MVKQTVVNKAVKKAVAKAFPAPKQAFSEGIANIKAGGDLFVIGFKIVVGHICAAKDYASQQDLIAQATTAYLAYSNTLKAYFGEEPIKRESAQKKLERECKKLKADYKIASDKPEAKKKQARKAQTGGKALKTGIKKADKKASKPVAIVKDGKVSADDVLAQIRSFETALEMVIPSKNIEPLRAATILYLATVKELCK